MYEVVYAMSDFDHKTNYHILSFAAVDDIKRTTFKPRTTAKSAADTTAPTGNNKGPYSVQNSWLIALSVVISLVMAPYGIS